MPENLIEVDCLVIGAGPVGSVAAREVAKNGWKVLMVEKRKEIGVPVRCGEGISKNTLSLVGLEKDPSYISVEMEGAKVISPNGSVIVMDAEVAGPECGFVLNRDRFDQELAKQAALQGVEIWTEAEAISQEMTDGKVMVEIDHKSNTKTVIAKIVVAADGFESLVARWWGFDTKLGLEDFASCLQYEMTGIETDGVFTEFFVGKSYVPAGYVWCFPKGKDRANIGLGVSGHLINEKATPKTYLDDFISKNPRFSKGTIVKTVGGGVSVCLPLEETVADNLIIVGDAARMIDPLTGGGIYNGCYAAIQAGKTICEALENEKYDKETLMPYEERWRERLEMEMARNFLAKEKLIEISDETLDMVVGAISEYDLKEMSTEELLKALKDKHPELIDELGSFL